MKIDHLITELCDYAERCELISPLDRAYAVASLMGILGLGEYTPAEITEERLFSTIYATGRLIGDLLSRTALLTAIFSTLR